MKKLLKYMRGYGKECVLGPLFKLLEASFELMIPLVVAKIVDTGIGGGDRGYVVRMSLVMVLLGVVGLVSAVTAQYFAAKASVGRQRTKRGRPEKPEASTMIITGLMNSEGWMVSMSGMMVIQFFAPYFS